MCVEDILNLAILSFSVNTDCIWTLVHAPSVSGTVGTWLDISNSSVQYLEGSSDGNTLLTLTNASNRIIGGYISTGSNNQSTPIDSLQNITEGLRLGSTIDGSAQNVWIGAKHIDSSDTSIRATLTWREL